MLKRAVAASLWFAVVWVGYEIVWSLTDLPRIAGPVIAFTVAALVTLDPLVLFWPRVRQETEGRPMTDVAGVSPAR